MDEQKHIGGCMCGEIRFDSKTPPKLSTICYCVYCRHSVGAASVAWLTFNAENFSFTKGTPTSYASSEGVIRTFCPTCGTSLTYTNETRPNEIDVTTGSMDHPENYPPTGNVMLSHKIPWDVHLDNPILFDAEMPNTWPQKL